MRRAHSIGQRRAAQTATRLSARIAAAFTGISVEATGGRIRLSGRGLLRRWNTDASMRWLGRLLR
jgi:hypothetical protein